MWCWWEAARIFNCARRGVADENAVIVAARAGSLGKERDLQGRRVHQGLAAPTLRTAEEVATAAGAPDETETVYLLLEHLVANGRVQIGSAGDPGQTTFTRT
jgi:hypothetical protein